MKTSTLKNPVRRHRTLLFLIQGLALAFAGRGIAEQRMAGHVPAAVPRLQAVQRLPETNSLKLAVGLTLHHRDALTNLLREVYDPASPNYHHYLTPAQFTEAFGPTEPEYQEAIRFAKERNLTVVGTHSNRMLLDVSGSVATIEGALGVTMRVYQHPTEARTFFAPDVEPSLNPNLRILHVSGLDNYTIPHPMHLKESVFPDVANATPKLGTGPQGTFIGSDFRAAYVPGTALTGAGQAVGLFELDGYYASDIAAYRSLAGLPNVALQNVLIDGFSGNPTGRRPGSGNEEVALDIEMAISMAPGLAQVLVYEAPPSSTMANIDDLLNRMATDNLAKQLSCSWGFDIDATSQQIFQQYAAQGQSFFLASGDSGAFVGGVLQPSDDPFITVVGGTTLTADSAQAWLSETTWSGSSGGISTLYPIPDWQLGIDMSSNQGSPTMRNVPDVAMIADNVLAISDRGRSAPFSGTSIAAPLWAAFTALVNEQGATSGQPPVGFINPQIYAIGKSPDYAASFHDITTGNSTSSSSPDLFSAVAGYDLCTGWGTPNGTNLIRALLAPTGEPLLITPPLGFTATGPSGGPFTVATQTYVLTNTGSKPLNWTSANTAGWLEVSPEKGTLVPGGPAAVVTVALNSAATNLLLGSFAANIDFTDLDTGATQNRPFSLLVGDGGFESGDFSAWTLSAQTQFNFVDSIDASTWNGGSSIPGIDDSLFVHTGIYGAFLGQNKTLGSLTQTLPTIPGQRYTLSFWLDNPGTGTPNEFRAAWNGTALFDQTDMDSFSWTNLQYVVTATGSSSIVQFNFRNDQNAFGLDDVSLEAVSSPLLRAVGQTNGAISLTWSGLAGISYQVQYSPDVTAATWTNLGAPLSAVDGTIAISDTLAAAPQRFYRIIISP